MEAPDGDIFCQNRNRARAHVGCAPQLKWHYYPPRVRRRPAGIARTAIHGRRDIPDCHDIIGKKVRATPGVRPRVDDLACHFAQGTVSSKRQQSGRAPWLARCAPSLLTVILYYSPLKNAGRSQRLAGYQRGAQRCSRRADARYRCRSA